MLTNFITLLDGFLNVIVKLPPGLWTLLAASIALIGVRATIRDQGKRLSLQFQHDRSLKDREREMQMRKEIFLSAAEAFFAGFKTLYRYAQPSITEQEITEDYTLKSSAFARLYVVATPGTSSAVTLVASKIAVAQWTLSTSRHQMMVSKTNVEVYDSLRERAEKERDHVFELAKEDDVAGSSDTERRARLSHSFKNYTNQINDLIKERMRFQYDVEVRRIALIREARALELEMVEAMLDTLSSLRTELELPVNKEEMRSTFEKSAADMHAPLERYLQHVESSLNIPK